MLTYIKYVYMYIYQLKLCLAEQNKFGAVTHN